MKKPNFFIVGAPKCGTSTINHTLRAHPQVYIPLSFEPNFFCTDTNRQAGHQPDLDWYLNLFRSADDSHTMVGEKSVSYLYSDEAIDNILEFEPQAKLIVCLRNPVNMVYSWHSELFFNLVEDQPDFRQAWALQDTRREGRHIPRLNRYAFALQYREIGRLGHYLQRLYTRIERERVHLIFVDDVKKDMDAVYRQLLDYLGLPFVPRAERRRLQAHREHRSQAIAYLLHPRCDDKSARLLRRMLNLTGSRRMAILNRLRGWNKKFCDRQPLNPAFVAELQATFRDDIGLLGEVTGRDLSHWLQ